MRTSSIGVVLTAWFLAATLVVAVGALGRLAVPPPAIVAVLAAVTVLFGLLRTSIRAWLETVDLLYLFLPHVVRFVGIAFLVLVSRGVLVKEFVPIGWGDTITAAGAVVLLFSRPQLSTSAGWWSVFAWNCFGFADMVFLVVTGIRLGSAAPEQFSLFRQFPFGLLPTFFVPLVVASHVFIFVRLFALKFARAA